MNSNYKVRGPDLSEVDNNISSFFALIKVLVFHIMKNKILLLNY